MRWLSHSTSDGGVGSIVSSSTSGWSSRGVSAVSSSLPPSSWLSSMKKPPESSGRFCHIFE